MISQSREKSIDGEPAIRGIHKEVKKKWSM